MWSKITGVEMRERKCEKATSAKFKIYSYLLRECSLLLSSAFTSHMSSAIQWQRHQLSAVAAADPPAWSVAAVDVVWRLPKGHVSVAARSTSFDGMHSGLGWSRSSVEVPNGVLID